MVEKVRGHLEWSAYPSLSLSSVRTIRPVVRGQVYAGVVIRDDHLSSELIRAGDVAVFQMGSVGRIGDLVVVLTSRGCEVEKMKPECACLVLGAVVRIERDYHS